MSDEQEAATPAPKPPSHVAYQVSRGKDGQSYFNRIGAAFEHKDGAGFDIRLSATPVDGRITLRTAEDRLASIKEGKQAGAAKGRDKLAQREPEPER